MNEFEVLKKALEREYKKVESENESEIRLHLGSESIEFGFKNGKLVGIFVDTTEMDWD